MLFQFKSFFITPQSYPQSADRVNHSAAARLRPAKQSAISNHPAAARAPARPAPITAFPGGAEGVGRNRVLCGPGRRGTLPPHKKTKKKGEANGLDGYDQKDLILQKNAAAGYTYTLTYKDGKKAYFDSSKRLCRMKDRFNNQIDFYYNKGSVVNIMDSAGRDLSLEKVPGGLQWHFKDPVLGEDMILARYEVEDHHLTASIDQEGRRTEYSYEQKSIDVRYIEQRMDDPVSIKYHLLKEIKHPTGAISLYMYDKRTGLAISEKGKTDKYVVASRADFMDEKEYLARGVRETRVNYERYTYSFATAGSDKNYQLYISSANLFRPNGMVETHSFDKKGKRTKEVDKFRNISKAVNTFEYDKNGMKIGRASCRERV